MPFVTSRIVYALLFYVLLVILLIISKPALIFEKDGSIKSFGVGEDKTMFSLGVFITVLAIFSFYIFALVDMIFSKQI